MRSIFIHFLQAVYTWLPIGFCLLCLGGNAQAEVTKTVRVTGLGLVVGQDLASAFEQAKKAALREAVEEAMGTLISAQTRVHNFAVIEDHILSRTEGYVRRFEVVEQGPVDENTYQVNIEAVVSLGQLHEQLEALNLLIEAAGNPRLACVGRERLVREGQDQEMDWGVVSGELVRVLQKASKQFRIAAPVFLAAPLLPGAAAREGLEGLIEAAARQADIVIVGDAIVQPVQGIRIPFSGVKLEETGIKSAVAEVRIKVLWADSREVVAEFTRVQKAADSSLEAAALKAIRQGILQVADELVERIAQDWREKVYSGRTIQVIVRAGRAQLDLFERDFPVRVGGIEKLYPRTYQAGEAVYEARSKNAAFQIARELSSKGLADLDVEILQVSLNTLKLQLAE